MINLFGKKILIVSPHPDDEAIGCGGLLARTKEEDVKISILYFCVGKCRQLVTGSTDEHDRLKEAKELEKYLQCKSRFVYIGDEFMRLDSLPQKELIDHIEDEVEKFHPDSVFIPMRSSYDQDHRAVFDATFTAFRPTPLNVRWNPRCIAEYEEPYNWQLSERFMPNCYIDLSKKSSQGKTYLEEKLKIFSFHKTQLREDPFPRSVENVIRWSQIRGAEVGIHAAEAYRIHRLFIE